MFLLILLPVLLLAFVVCAVWLGARAARLADGMARRQKNDVPYPTARMLEATQEVPPEGVWPPTPEVLPPETQPREHSS